MSGSAGVREVVTPEGVPLRFGIASAGDRVGAFVVDCALLSAAAIAIGLVAMLAVATGGGLGAAAVLVAFFLLRSFYFTWFECRPGGATPGKRLLGLRVIDLHGGMLTPEAVFARNFMREIELFVPLSVALAPDSLLPDLPGWAPVAAAAWLFLLAALPFFNRDHLRAGDLVAGTMVVRSPGAVLLEDLSVAPREDRRAQTLEFTPAQLDLYGIHELQVLEALLRQSAAASTLDAVAKQIQAKIGWRPAARPPGAVDFLQAFYTAQRARLEQRLLLGERRESKRA